MIFKPQQEEGQWCSSNQKPGDSVVQVLVLGEGLKTRGPHLVSPGPR
jgi:hypothetical protein